MNKPTLILIAILTTLSTYGQDITGQWNGLLKVQGIQLRVVFNISKSDNGYNSTMDSPDQGAKGIPVTSTSFENSVLKLAVTNLRVEYEGTLTKHNNITGTFKQAGQSFPMDLSREKIEKVKIVRTQEPTAPFPYYSEDVKFENTQDKIILAGTLTLPAKEGLFPVVILISGSGPQNRDEELMGHKPFLVLADHLTRKGIAVLRFDDRGTAESTGDFKTATTPDFARDVESAIKYLKTRKEVNKKQIGLIGHSEGGIIAPMVAAGSKDVNFIVLLAGTGIRGDQLLLLQQELIGKASGINDADLQKSKVINKGVFDIVLKSNDDPSLKTKLTTHLKQTMKDVPASAKPAGMNEDDYIKLQVSQLTAPWMNYFIKYDPAPMLEKVRCPVLAVNGSKDLQVPAKVNLEAIDKALKKGGNKKVVTKILPNLNHLFQECTTGSPAEYATIEQTFSPIALDEISGWILNQVRTNPNK
jgi:pimeloyl-ACP methyl ester carboxylesterase